jgi:hypothetical protein
MFFYFVDIKRGNFGIYGSINGSIKFKNQGIIQILIPRADSKPIILLLLFDIKYYPQLDVFNLILVS